MPETGKIGRNLNEIFSTSGHILTGTTAFLANFGQTGCAQTQSGVGDEFEAKHNLLNSRWLRLAPRVGIWAA
jgi:hypothetical protein